MVSKTERKICGTCEFWTGKRKPIFDQKGKPKVDIIDEVGECQNVVCSFCDKSRKKDRVCQHYSKWPELF